MMHTAKDASAYYEDRVRGVRTMGYGGRSGGHDTNKESDGRK